MFLALQKMRFRVFESEAGDLQSGGSSHQPPFTPPPAYDSTHMEHPPDYQDALQDVILSTGMVILLGYIDHIKQPHQYMLLQQVTPTKFHYFPDLHSTQVATYPITVHRNL